MLKKIVGILKKAAVVMALLGIAAAGLYQFAGVRIAVNGSGMWPRFLLRAPDYDALDADRARQRERPLRATAESAGERPQTRVATPAVPAPERTNPTTAPAAEAVAATSARARGY